MSGVVLEANISDLTAIEHLLLTAMDQLENLEPMMDDIGQEIETMAVEAFENETGPDGKAWKKSARVRVHGGQTLSLSSTLKNSWIHEATSDSVRTGSPVEYSAIHALGMDAPVTVKSHTREMKSGKIVNVRSHKRHMKMPQRKILPDIGEIPVEALEDILWKHLEIANGHA